VVENVTRLVSSLGPVIEKYDVALLEGRFRPPLSTPPRDEDDEEEEEEEEDASSHGSYR